MAQYILPGLRHRNSEQTQTQPLPPNFSQPSLSFAQPGSQQLQNEPSLTQPDQPADQPADQPTDQPDDQPVSDSQTKGLLLGLGIIGALMATAYFTMRKP